MKSIYIIIVILTLSYYCSSQIDSRRGYDYLAEFGDTNMLYTDVFCRNYDDDPWPAVGNNRSEMAFHYSYSYRYEETLSMISYHYTISAIEYSEFFIYDVFQNLTHYIYNCGDTEMLYKVNTNGLTLLRSKGEEDLAMNYFFNEDGSSFEYEQVISRSDAGLDRCHSIVGIPNYKRELQLIRENYKNTNEIYMLKPIVKENATGYYNKDDKLIKIVVKENITKEYYIENDKLYFAYYTSDASTPELRLYCFHSSPFRFLYGKENIAKTEEDFWNQAEIILEEYREIKIKFE